MTSIIEKRRSLHKNLANQQAQNNTLKLQISQLQALANIGISMCMIAHEINNLLTPLSSYSALALKNPDDRHLTEKALQKTIQNCERASKITDSMLGLVDGETQEKEKTEKRQTQEEIKPPYR